LYRVGDLDDEQIKEFLDKRNIDPAIQDKVRNLVGGRVLLLSRVCKDLNAGIQFESMLHMRIYYKHLFSCSSSSKEIVNIFQSQE
jgi:hypothetical protein